MFCSISGQVPQDPVVAVKTGLLYERRLIEKAIDTNGKCPVSEVELSKDDLTSINASTVPAPRPVEGTSIVGLLTKFQDEWDSLMLETFKLRQQLGKTRQELSQALYQYDAACRVIARVTKERDEARQLVALGGGNAAAAASGNAAPANNNKRDASELENGAETGKPEGISKKIVEAIKSTSKTLSKSRKKMKKMEPENLVPRKTMQEWQVTKSHTLHKTTKPGIKSVDVHPTQVNHVVTGGVDGDLKILDHSTGKIVCTLHGHRKAVTSVQFHEKDPMIVSCSADHSARVWVASGDDSVAANYSAAHVFELHSDSVTSCAIHPTGDFITTVSMDKSWALTDIREGTCVSKINSKPVTYLSSAIHPDGLLFAAGARENVVQIWDVCSQTMATELPQTGATTCLAFSENGYYFATGSNDGVMSVWDLRKIGTDAQVVQTYSDLGSVDSVCFDRTGYYLAYGHGKGNVTVRATKENFEEVQSFSKHTKPVTGVRFAQDAQYLVSSAMDRHLVFYGLK